MNELRGLQAATALGLDSCINHPGSAEGQLGRLSGRSLGRFLGRIIGDRRQ